MMNQSYVVPSCDIIEENPAALSSSSKPNHLLLPTVDYEVAELTWKDGHLGMHGFGVPKAKDNIYTLALAGGTLESIVNQATAAGGEQLVTSWFDGQPTLRIPQSLPLPVNAMSCTLVGSCSVTPTLKDTGGFTSGSAGNTSSSAKDGTKNTVDEHDSIWHSRNEQGGDKEEDKKRVTVLGKRSRCAAVHNQSERKRRDKINQRMSILQKLVPNSSKTDKASMLDEVIEYMKQLQNKVDMMSRMNMSTIMLPLAALQQQQQLQMSFISSPPGAMGFNLMDINHPRQPGMPTPQGFYPNPFNMASWDHHNNNRPQSTSDIPSFSAASFLPSHSQPQASMTMDGGHVPSADIKGK